MKYASGNLVALNDVIWWDGGVGVGHVIEIVSTDSQMQEWGQDEPGIIVSYDGSKSFGGNYVGIPEKFIRSDGINKVDSSELILIESVIKNAKDFAGIDNANYSAGVFSKYYKLKRLFWFVTLYINKKSVAYIRVSPDGKECVKAKREESPSIFGY